MKNYIVKEEMLIRALSNVAMVPDCPEYGTEVEETYLPLHKGESITLDEDFIPVPNGRYYFADPLSPDVVEESPAASCEHPELDQLRKLDQQCYWSALEAERASNELDSLDFDGMSFEDAFHALIESAKSAFNSISKSYHSNLEYDSMLLKTRSKLA